MATMTFGAEDVPASELHGVMSPEAEDSQSWHDDAATWSAENAKSRARRRRPRAAPPQKKTRAAPQGRSRRELPAHAVSILKAWLVSDEHFHHPYPTQQDQAHLMAQTGIDKKQLKNWFTNARRRIWKPLVRTRLEAEGAIAPGGDLDEALAADARRHAGDRDDGPPAFVPDRLRDDGAAAAAPAEHARSTRRQTRLASGAPPEAPAQDDEFLRNVDSESFLDALAEPATPPGAAPAAGDDALAGAAFFDDAAFDRDPRGAPPPRGSRKRPLPGDDAAPDGYDDAPPPTVRVSRDASCAFCARGNVDTQLMPCKHLFHGQCLRPWLEATVTTPVCPCCSVAIANCVRAAPA